MAMNFMKKLVGLNELPPDPKLEEHSEKVEHLNKVVLQIKKQFEKYGQTVLDMTSVASTLGNSVQKFYAKSAQRANSVQIFVDSQFSIDSVAINLFREQYGWELMKVFDDWSKELTDTKAMINNAEKARLASAQYRSKLSGLREEKQNRQAKGKQWTQKDEGQLGEVELQFSQATRQFDSLTEKIDKSVEALVSDRFARFDRAFVRFMEIQTEFFKGGSKYIDLFAPNITNYRKRFPRENGSSEAASGPAQKIHVDTASDNKGFEVIDAHEPLESPDVESSPEKKDKDKHEPSQPTTPDSQSSDASVEPKLAPASNLGKPVQSSRPPSSQQGKQNQAPQAAKQVQPTQQPAPAAKPTQPPIDILTGINSGPSPDASPQAQPQTGSQAPATGQPNVVDIFNFVPVEAPPPTGSGSNSGPNSSKGVAATFNIIDLEPSGPPSTGPSKPEVSASIIDPNLFSTEVFTAPVNTTVEKLDTSQMTKEELQNYIAKNAESKVQQKRTKETQMKLEIEQAKQALQDVGDRLDAWEFKSGHRKHIRTLLSSLHTVLWPDAEWKPVSLANLMDAASIKKVYRKAILLVHPDRSVGAPAEQKAIAERVFEALNGANDSFLANPSS